MSDLDEVGSQLQIQLQICICVVPFEDALHIWLQSHLCLTLDEVGGQLSMQVQLQIHICVVSFEGPLHLQCESHLCLTLDEVGVNSRSIFVLYLLRVHSISGSSPIYVSP